MLNSFVVGRCMVVMPKWDAAEALRLIEKEKITYFVGVPTMSLELMNHPDRAQIRPVVADRHHRRRRAAADQPCRAAAAGVSRRPAGARLWPDRNQRGRLQQFLGQLCGQARLDRPAAETVGRNRDPGRRRRATCPPGERGEIAIRAAANINGYWRNPAATDGAVHAPTATSAPATSAISTRTTICSSSTARRTSSSAAARISPRPRSRRACYACPEVAEASVFGVPDDRLGEVPVAVIHCKDGSASTKTACAIFSTARSPRSRCRRGSSSPPNRCRASAPARSTGVALKAQYAAVERALEARPAHVADRRRRRHRPGRRLRRLAAAPRQRSRDRQGRAGVRRVPQDRPRRARHGRGAAGRDRAGHLDRAAADRRRRTGRGLGDGRRSSRRRWPPPMPIRCAECRRMAAGARTGDRAITAGSTSIRAFEQPLREAGGDRPRDADRRRRRRWNVDPARMRHRRRLRRSTAADAHLRRTGRGSRRPQRRRRDPPPRDVAQGASDRPAAAAARPPGQERRQLPLRRRRSPARTCCSPRSAWRRRAAGSPASTRAQVRRRSACHRAKTNGLRSSPTAGGRPSGAAARQPALHRRQRRRRQTCGRCSKQRSMRRRAELVQSRRL